MSQYHILVNCTDQKGLIYRVTKSILSQELNIINNLEFVEKETNRFFMRSEITGTMNQQILFEQLQQALPEVAEIKIVSDQHKKIVVLATREYHCLGDLLLRHQFGELKADIQAVISNHNILGNLTKRFDLPFYYETHENKSREAHEAAIAAIIDNYQPDYIVLAKYMRILSQDFVKRYSGKIINIHHSFLPAFAGANPYRQAFDRGVKIIGATSHFVTADLDEGPIISQNVVEVDHTHSVKEMAQAGRDVEKVVLAKALKLVFENRVFISQNRVIILK